MIASLWLSPHDAKPNINWMKKSVRQNFWVMDKNSWSFLISSFWYWHHEDAAMEFRFCLDSASWILTSINHAVGWHFLHFPQRGTLAWWHLNVPCKHLIKKQVCTPALMLIALILRSLWVGLTFYCIINPIFVFLTFASLSWLSFLQSLCFSLSDILCQTENHGPGHLSWGSP